MWFDLDALDRSRKCWRISAQDSSVPSLLNCSSLIFPLVCITWRCVDDIQYPLVEKVANTERSDRPLRHLHWGCFHWKDKMWIARLDAALSLTYIIQWTYSLFSSLKWPSGFVSTSVQSESLLGISGEIEKVWSKVTSGAFLASNDLRRLPW